MPIKKQKRYGKAIRKSDIPKGGFADPSALHPGAGLMTPDKDTKTLVREWLRVGHLQLLLRVAGFTQKTPTGIFDSDTQAAVEDAQRTLHHAPVTGEYNASLGDKIRAFIAGRESQVARLAAANRIDAEQRKALTGKVLSVQEGVHEDASRDAKKDGISVA